MPATQDSALSDADLIAELIGGRTRDRAAAARVLGDLGGLAGLARADEHELTLRTRGARRARTLTAALELASRLARAHEAPQETLTSGADVARWAAPRLAALEYEELWVLALDGRSRLRGARCVARGGLHGLGARPSDVLRAALRLGTSAFVIVHNHPSGDATPSPEDVRFTARAAEAAAAVGLVMLDHVVVAGRAYASVPGSEASTRAADASG